MRAPQPPAIIAAATDPCVCWSVGLLMLKNVEGFINWGAVMATTVFFVLPPLVVFFFAQRQIIAGLTQGARKG